MSDKSEAIDFAETLIAHLLLAKDDDRQVRDYTAVSKRANGVAMAIDIAQDRLMKLDSMRPSTCYAFDIKTEREFAVIPELLLSSVPDILGEESEVAILTDSQCLWFGARRARKLPRGMGVIGKAAALYEVHARAIFPDGTSTYNRGMAAISAKGMALPCMYPNSTSSGVSDGKRLILTAAAIEDTGRTGHFTASVKESATVIFPVPYGEQIELFKMREAPLLPSGRKKAILHWVAKHVRRRGNKESAVSEHVRGVHEFACDGLTVRLEANDTIETRRAA